jgi:hypothetical protein
MPAPGDRRLRHPGFFRVFIDQALMYGEINLHRSGTYDGAAVWLDVDAGDNHQTDVAGFDEALAPGTFRTVPDPRQADEPAPPGRGAARLPGVRRGHPGPAAAGRRPGADRTQARPARQDRGTRVPGSHHGRQPPSVSVDPEKMLPDPVQLRGLAVAWSAMADELRGLAKVVSGAVNGAAWSEDGRQAAVRASGEEVVKAISTAADKAARFAQQIATAAMNYGQAGAVLTSRATQPGVIFFV